MMMELDVTQSLKDTENSLRDFVSLVLEKAHGPNWIEKAGLSSKTLEQWNRHKENERNKQGSGVVESRLIYYADFSDLEKLLERNWDHFSAAFESISDMRFYLGELKRLRDPDAHRRELLPYQKHLILGVSGEIRTRIIRYRSALETADGYFPRIGSARDSVGNIWTPGELRHVCTGHVLHPEDVVDYVVTASDPLGKPLRYRLRINLTEYTLWQDDHVLSFRVRNSDIGRNFYLQVEIQSGRSLNWGNGADDGVEFDYCVLPAPH